MSSQVVNVPRAVAAVNEDERLRIERKCREIMVLMGHYLDSGMFEAFVDCFTVDAEWHRC